MYQDLVDAMEKTSICSIEESLWNLIGTHEANSRNRSCDFPVDTSFDFRRKLDDLINRFLEELVSGQLDLTRARDIAHTLISVRCYTAR